MGVDTLVRRTRHLTACRRAQSLHVALCACRCTSCPLLSLSHIGHEDVVVVINFYVAIFVRDLLYQEMYSLHFTINSPCQRMTVQIPFQEETTGSSILGL